jgi:hypothetical protein
VLYHIRKYKKIKIMSIGKSNYSSFDFLEKYT